MKQQLHVQVCDPIVKDGVKKYILYTIRGCDKVGNFEVLRRYNDFSILRNTVFRQNLIQRWPGCYIPPIPPKKAVGNLEPKFIETRRKYLNTFCLELSQLPYIWYGEEFDIFIRSSNPDILQALQALPVQTIPQITEKYEQSFQQLSGVFKFDLYQFFCLKKEINQSFLKRVEPLLENYKTMALNISANKAQNNQQIQTLLEYLLPEYEQCCLNEYVEKKEQKTIFKSEVGKTQLQTYVQFINYFKYFIICQKDIYTVNSFIEASEMLQDEQIEIEKQAFADIFSGKEKYDLKKAQLSQSMKDLEEDISKLKSGRSVLRMSFESKENSIQRLEQSIMETKKEIESVQFLCDLQLIIIGYNEIDKFKKEKEQKYYNLIRCLCNSEIEQAKQVSQ